MAFYNYGVKNPKDCRLGGGVLVLVDDRTYGGGLRSLSHAVVLFRAVGITITIVSHYCCCLTITWILTFVFAIITPSCFYCHLSPSFLLSFFALYLLLHPNTYREFNAHFNSLSCLSLHGIMC